MPSGRLPVGLREVTPQDVEIFYLHQIDPEGAAMAAMPSRDHGSYLAHWDKIFADPSNITKAVVLDGEVVGSMVSWTHDGVREVGYWIDRAHWGRGIAKAALAAFLNVITERPLVAHVAEHNTRSLRVVESCGFVRTAKQPPPESDGVQLIEFELR